MREERDADSTTMSSRAPPRLAQLLLPWLYLTELNLPWPAAYLYPPLVYVVVMSVATSLEVSRSHKELTTCFRSDSRGLQGALNAEKASVVAVGTEVAAARVATRLRQLAARGHAFVRSWVRVLPCMVLSSGMLMHQACAWAEGIVTENSVFERTPKTGAHLRTHRRILDERQATSLPSRQCTC